MIRVKQQHLPKRCEVCHQSDLFDQETGECQRCSPLVVIQSGPILQPTCEGGEKINFFVVEGATDPAGYPMADLISLVEFDRRDQNLRQFLIFSLGVMGVAFVVFVILIKWVWAVLPIIIVVHVLVLTGFVTISRRVGQCPQCRTSLKVEIHDYHPRPVVFCEDCHIRYR